MEEDDDSSERDSIWTEEAAENTPDTYCQCWDNLSQIFLFEPKSQEDLYRKLFNDDKADDPYRDIGSRSLTNNLPFD
jgi:hypothetical protein